MTKASALATYPVKWQHSASDVVELPSFEVAIRAFANDLETRGIGLITEFHSRRSRFCVFGCKFALEYSTKQTLHLRMRSPGSTWILSPEVIESWPEIGSCTRALTAGFLGASWLRVALANIFEAWSRDYLPSGYRYQNPLCAVNAALPDLANYDQCIRKWYGAIRLTAPPKFWSTFGISPESWASLPDLAAPLHVWNAHRKELTELNAKEWWIRAAVRVLAQKPTNIPLGETIEQSIKTLIIRIHSKTVWRFHLESRFAMAMALPHRNQASGEFDVGMLIGNRSECAAAIITSTVKALGMKRAQTMLFEIGTRYFRFMVDSLHEMASSLEHMSRLTIVMARAADKLDLSEGHIAVSRNDLIDVIRGLARLGFAEGFPSSNSTWDSLVRRAVEWNRIGDTIGDDLFLPSVWKAPISDWNCEDVQFTAITDIGALKAEGAEMAHCAATYHHHCARGLSAIYRVKGLLSSGKQVRATVEFVRPTPQRPWDIAQLKGKENCKVDDQVWKMAALFASDLNRAGRLRLS